MPTAAVARALAYPFAAPDGDWALGTPEGRDQGERVALLAYGANADPDVLAGKLGPAAAARGVLARRVWVAGLDVVFSAHVSPYGAIPGTLCAAPGAAVLMHELRLDPDQLARLDATEPNYVRRPALAGGAEAYVSRHGALRVGGAPLALAAVPARGRRLPAGEERDALRAARDRLAPGEPLEAFVEAQAADPALAAARTRALRADALPLGLEGGGPAGRDRARR
jgi:hypothetical protein